jgi:hypothetical protein
MLKYLYIGVGTFLPRLALSVTSKIINEKFFLIY